MKFSQQFFDADFDNNKKVKIVTNNINYEVELNKEENKDLINKIIQSPVDYKNIFGYKMLAKDKSIIYCKYKKDTEDFITYKGNKIISYMKKTFRSFNGEKYINYVDEI